MARRAVNTNRQGANFELKIMHDLERYGYTCHRSSGSRGAVDVMAISENRILMIQAKISQPVIPPKERKAVLALADMLRDVAVPLVAYRVGGKVGYRLLAGPGPKDWLLWEPEPVAAALCAFCEHRHGIHQEATGCWFGEAALCWCAGFQLKA